MKGLLKGSLEETMLQARKALVEHSKTCDESLILVSTFKDYMVVMNESEELFKLGFKDEKVISEEKMPSVQSIAHNQKFSLLGMISEDVKRIKNELSEVQESKKEIQLDKQVNQYDNLKHISDQFSLLEAKAKDKEKRWNRYDKSFFKKLLGFIDDMGVYLKRLLKESNEISINDTLLEDMNCIASKMVNVLDSIDESNGRETC